MSAAGSLSRPVHALLLLVAAIVAACSAQTATREPSPEARRLAQLAHGYGQRSLVRITNRMDPAMLAVALRHDPLLIQADDWNGPEGWRRLDMQNVPRIAAPTIVVAAEQARRLNAMLPVADALPDAARPFVLRATGAERERAVLCLTQAIYFEAALESREGQEAVAQTVLNRMRHPDFPHTVCGVVYQGSQRITGCQFSFTCDGSRSRGTVPAIWRTCREVAERALNGYVQPRVGTATFYHADYVFPAWGPTLMKITQIGAHIFYRFPGPAGAVTSFSRRWTPGELMVSMEGPPASQVLLAQAARNGDAAALQGMTILQITDPNSPTGLRTRVAGQVLFGRRQPTRDEIARINANLATLEARNPGLTSANEMPVSSAGGDDDTLPHNAAPRQPPAPAISAPTRQPRTPGDRPPVEAGPAPWLSTPAP